MKIVESGRVGVGEVTQNLGETSHQHVSLFVQFVDSFLRYKRTIHEIHETHEIPRNAVRPLGQEFGRQALAVELSTLRPGNGFLRFRRCKAFFEKAGRGVEEIERSYYSDKLAVVHHGQTTDLVCSHQLKRL